MHTYLYIYVNTYLNRFASILKTYFQNANVKMPVVRDQAHTTLQLIRDFAQGSPGHKNIVIKGQKKQGDYRIIGNGFDAGTSHFVAPPQGQFHHVICCPEHLNPVTIMGAQPGKMYPDTNPALRDTWNPWSLHQTPPTNGTFRVLNCFEYDCEQFKMWRRRFARRRMNDVAQHEDRLHAINAFANLKRGDRRYRMEFKPVCIFVKTNSLQDLNIAVTPQMEFKQEIWDLNPDEREDAIDIFVHNIENMIATNIHKVIHDKLWHSAVGRRGIDEYDFFPTYKVEIICNVSLIFYHRSIATSYFQRTKKTPSTRRKRRKYSKKKIK